MTSAGQRFGCPFCEAVDREPFDCPHGGGIPLDNDTKDSELERLRKQLDKAERLLAEIEHGKHSVPGALVQIRRYFDERGEPSLDAMRRYPGNVL